MWNNFFLRALQQHHQRLAAAAVATGASGLFTLDLPEDQQQQQPHSFYNYFNPSNHYTLAEKKHPTNKQNVQKASSSSSTTTKEQKETTSDDHPDDDDDDDYYYREDDEDFENGEDGEELPPWWGARLTRRLTRHFTRQTVRYEKPKKKKKDDQSKIPTDDGADYDGSTGASKPVDESTLFHGQCLKRQMRTPAVPYPAWDYDWDGRMTEATSLEGHRSGKASSANSRNKTKHIILVRHGQYDEYPQDDVNRKLTALGRRQAIKTGQRLAAMARGSNKFRDVATRGPCPIKVIRVSNMRRARETAELIAREIEKHAYEVKLEIPDPDLNEALPAPMLPIRPELAWATEEIDIHKDRVEKAFLKYFYRDTATEDKIRKRAEALKKGAESKEDDENEEIDNEKEEEEDDDEDEDACQDEFEIIVGHGNVIRYFFCRALQLPPEAWLRLSLFNCSLTYLMIRPNGMVTARMLGDIGHLDYEETTFSSNRGFKW